MPAIAAVNSSNPCLSLSDSVSSHVVSDNKSCLRSLGMKKIRVYQVEDGNRKDIKNKKIFWKIFLKSVIDFI